MYNLKRRFKQKIDDIRYRINTEIAGYRLAYLTFRIYLNYVRQEDN